MPELYIPTKHRPLLRVRRRWRRGITLMETIFAIGVILTGLLGLAALIPIAAGNARSTMELDRSVGQSTSVAAAGVARELMSLDSLVIYDKPVAGSGPRWSPTTYAYTYLPSNQPQTVRWKIEVQSNYDRPLGESLPQPEVTFGKLESPGYGHHPLSSGLTAGICIDPNGMPALPLVGANSATSLFPSPAGSNAYDYSRFPYFSERYNPLDPPNLSAPLGSVAAAPAWPMSPRMWRATLISNLQDDGAAPVHAREMMPEFASRNIFTGFAGLTSIDGPEKDDPLGLLSSRTQVNGIFVDAGQQAASEYTWFATLAPPINGGTVFRQSIVVVRQRVASVPMRVGDPLALDSQDRVIEDPEDNPSGERLTWIGQSIGFNGGAGGDVLIYGSQAVVNNITPNEWVMLSRQPHNPSTGAPTGPAVHRWYRVLSVEAPESGVINSSIAEPNWTGASTHSIWRRWITLAGPDWSFGLPNAAAADLADDTFCTIVQGAISVYQSEIQLD